MESNFEENMVEAGFGDPDAYISSLDDSYIDDSYIDDWEKDDNNYYDDDTSRKANTRYWRKDKLSPKEKIIHWLINSDYFYLESSENDYRTYYFLQDYKVMLNDGRIYYLIDWLLATQIIGNGNFTDFNNSFEYDDNEIPDSEFNDYDNIIEDFVVLREGDTIIFKDRLISPPFKINISLLSSINPIELVEESTGCRIFDQINESTGKKEKKYEISDINTTLFYNEEIDDRPTHKDIIEWLMNSDLWCPTDCCWLTKESVFEGDLQIRFSKFLSTSLKEWLASEGIDKEGIYGDYEINITSNEEYGDDGHSSTKYCNCIYIKKLIKAPFDPPTGISPYEKSPYPEPFIQNDKVVDLDAPAFGVEDDLPF